MESVDGVTDVEMDNVDTYVDSEQEEAFTESEKKDTFNGTPSPRSQQPFFSGTENIYKLKVVLIGDVSVGKTSLAVRFSHDKFDENYKQTIGASFISKIVIVKSDVIHFQIWDTAGQERYKSLVPMYLRGAHIAFIVYDITQIDSFKHIDFWLDALRHHCDMVTIVLVANKCDLESVVDEGMALAYAQEHGLQYVTASAKTGYNVERLFHSIGSKAVERLKSQQVTITQRGSRTNNDNQIVQIDKQDTDKPKKKRKCCRT